MNNHCLPTEVKELVEFLVARLECLLWGLRGLERKMNEKVLWEYVTKKKKALLFSTTTKKLTLKVKTLIKQYTFKNILEWH